MTDNELPVVENDITGKEDEAFGPFGPEVVIPSKRFSLNTVDWKKIATGASVAIAGTLLTYLTDVLTKLIADQSIPPSVVPIVTAGWAILSNIIRKWITGQH